MTDFLYQYPPLYAGKLIKRYQRFFTDIELDSGEIITAHCANTGPMIGVYVPGSPVLVSHHDHPQRKLKYTWEMIELNHPNPVWVGVNTALPNRVIKLALEAKLFPQLGDYQKIKTEVVYGEEKKSRVDFLLETPTQKIYLEVKNTTWCQEKLALFPDTVTERGQKHLRELIKKVEAGERAVMLYFINRGDCTHFSPGDEADPIYGSLFRQAQERGVEILPCRFSLTPYGIRYLGLANIPSLSPT